MKDRRVRTERFLPHAYERLGLRCDLRRVEVDGHAGTDDLDQDAHLVDLRGSWSTARLVFEVPPQRPLFERLVPEAERAVAPLAVLVAIAGAKTRLRRGVVVPVENPDVPTELVIELRRDDLAGSVELQPYLVRTSDAKAPQPGLADKRGHRLASTRPWTVRVDMERPPAGQHLDVQFKSFREDVAIPHGERGAMWRLDAMTETPILWLNQDHASIADLLRHEGSRGRRAYLREVVYDRIGASVWPQLFMMAATCMLEVGEETYGWEASVLDLLLPDLYPTLATHERRLEQLRKEFDDLPLVLSRLDAILQSRDSSVAHLTRLVEVL